jgi:D-psicose/D-tagatose/L-ribulose 3-epimerase
MKFAINTLLFASPFTTRSAKLFRQFKDWGFDGVEIAIEDPSHLDLAKTRAELDRAELECIAVCGMFGPNRDLRGNAEQQHTSLEYLRYAVDAAVALGAPVIIGPSYSSVGRAQAYSLKEKKAQWRTVVKNFKTICAYAEPKGVSFAIEPLNRFETDFINTCDQALQMVADVGSPALKVQLDTFHMNIEEKDSAAAIRRAGKNLGHFHACGCDRGTPGNDHIDWPNIAKALKAVRYNGAVVIESFSQEIEVIAKAAAIWRQFEPSREAIAVQGLKFLRKTLG